MGCSAATLDSDEGRYDCAVSGSQCMYLIPNSKRCAEEYGEGPDAQTDEAKVEMNILNLNKMNKNGCIYPEEGVLHHELTPMGGIIIENGDPPPISMRQIDVDKGYPLRININIKDS